MALAIAQANKLSQEALQLQIVDAFASQDPFLSWLPIIPLEGNAIAYNRELALGDADYIAIDGTITAVQQTYTKVTEAWKQIIRDEEVPNLIGRTNSGLIDQYGEAIRKGVKAVALHLMEKLISGDEDSNAEEIDGLRYLTADAPWSSQVVNAGADSSTAAAITFKKLDELIDMADLGNTADMAFIMPHRTRRSIRELLRSAGGATPEYIEIAGNRVLSYAGIPIFANSYCSTTLDDSGEGDNDESRIYLLSRQEGSGAALFVPASNQNAADGNPLGIEVENLGNQATKDNTKIRVKFYHGFAVRGGKQMAWMRNITN